MKRLHYAELENTNDIRGIEFDELKDLTAFVYEKTADIKTNKVYLLTFNMGDDCTNCPIFVDTDAVGFIASISSVSPEFYEEFVDDYFLHEYETFADAYAGALLMKEMHPLCGGNLETIK